MNLMWRRLRTHILILALTATAFACKDTSPAGTSVDSQQGPTALVKVVPITESVMAEPVTAYGSVVPAPGSLRTVSLSYDAQVLSAAVSEGEEVKAGGRLIEVRGSADARLELDETRLKTEALKRAYEQAKAMNQVHLADDSALESALKDYESSSARQKSLESRGLAASEWLTASVSGVVTRLTAQTGAVVPAGEPLAEIADPGKIAVRLGVEPSAAKTLKPGAKIFLRAIDGKDENSAGTKILSIAPAVNPSTRLVDIYAALPGRSPFLLGEYVEGVITAEGIKNLVVPYEAVLPREGRRVIFTVDKGRAVLHEVTVLAETDRTAAVAGAGLAAGQSVVTTGAYELEDGMSVRTDSAQ
jgi:membrane fusion protein, multidrug efflux system